MVGEIKRILKPGGKAYLSTVGGSFSYVNDAEWEEVLKEFEVEERNDEPFKGGRWAKVAKKETDQSS